MSESARTRCAIYTRKSSDEGLEQAFNSLDAQREACSAYVLSQAGEGWSALGERYDDGGLSGGTLERPALQRLLADVDAGRVDLVVVYKVDRLTRSLLDFSKLVERFDAAGVSFVSVTQAFNTTTSMGRLTLNMLLSFAQFEREVTAERIRDKIAASKAKGMWMGGTPPLGYTPDGRTLAVVEEHASLVRHLFARYLARGSVRSLEEELRREGIGLPVRERLNGTGSYGGGWFSRGQIYKILSNPVYVGRIQHGAQSYPGLHPAIVDPDSWEYTQAKLADHRQGTRSRVRAASPSLFAGKLVDEAGEPLVASHASKGKVRYRYYVSRALHEGRTGEGRRIPALELETAVCGRLAEAFSDPVALAGSIGAVLTPASAAGLAGKADATLALLRRRDRAAVLGLVEQVRLQPHGLRVTCASEAIADALGTGRHPDAPTTVTLTAEATLTRTGRAMRLVQPSGAGVQRSGNPALLRLVMRARRWWATLRQGELTITELAAAEGLMPAYMTRVLRLAFLSPEVTTALLKGELRAEVTAGTLTTTGAVPACWREQASAMLAG